MIKEAEERKQGMITGLVFEDGFGFLTTADGLEYFFHASDVKVEEGDDPEEDKFELLSTGQKVSFVPYWNLKRKKWRALGVAPIGGKNE